MERTAIKKPGYDCRNGKCQHEKKGDHGICGDIWYYVVKEGELALSLYVLSTNYPPGVDVPVFLMEQGPIAGDLSMHVGYPMKGDDEPRDCDWTDSKKCYGMFSTALGGKAFFEEHGVDNYEQPESFWKAMEEKFKEWAPEYQRPEPPIEKGTRIVEV